MADEAAEDQLRQARKAPADAEGARDAELPDAIVINRCYYACLYAAQAVLYDRGHDPSSHGGVLSLFGSETVAEGDALTTVSPRTGSRNSASRPTMVTGTSTRTSGACSNRRGRSSRTPRS